MADILHRFPIKAPVERVFRAISTPAGLDTWWTSRSTGKPRVGEVYELWFGPEHDWRAKVTRCEPPTEFELTMDQADAEWTGTTVGFQLESRGDGTWVEFRHAGWPEVSEHFRISCTCWAMYLRVLRRFLEHGEVVAYADRLDA